MIINGIEVSAKIKDELKKEIETLKKKGINPCLATILIGNDPASSIYVKNKHKACTEIGIETRDNRIASTIHEEELIQLVESLNNDTSVHGILVQLPFPSHINEFKVINSIRQTKDVDGLTYYNAGLLLNNKPYLIPCTPLGVIELLKYYDIEPEGKDVVIVNRSILVGKPLALLLLHRNATVTLCHSKTKNLEEKLRTADIVITGVGNRKLFMLKAECIKKNAIVIDIGISRDNGKIVGDVDFENVSQKASWITPVPGGVGPMTVAMLLKNTVIAASNDRKIDNG